MKWGGNIFKNVLAQRKEVFKRLIVAYLNIYIEKTMIEIATNQNEALKKCKDYIFINILHTFALK